MALPIRERDISGIRFPKGSQGGEAGGVVTYRPPVFEPPYPGAREFLVSFSALVPGAGAVTALFTLAGDGSVVVPSCAVRLPQDNQARISGVSVGGDTNVGNPILTFFIGADPTGQKRVPGWDGYGLPGRGGIVAVGLAPYTWITEPGSFFGGFVINTDAAPKYAEMTMVGWMW